jgi:type II restriction/modification system DNA methylase subunit YeeA
METAKLKRFAQGARRRLLKQVETRLDMVLHTDSAVLREKAAALRELEKQIDRYSREAVIERAAYTWFNRFAALRYMDVKGFSGVAAVSPVKDGTQPEILREAKLGYIEPHLRPYVDEKKVLDILSGTIPSDDAQREAYGMLLTAVCNHYHTVMPFMFEKIADFTELLLPADLLSGDSVLAALREAMTPEACRDVEVIGWLYQYYISEKKDEVFAALKKNKKIEAKNIPAATQLFTPHWIVKYLAQNSLGRLWMLNHPDSSLKERMEYYIEPEQPESDFLRISSPEELKICDPACGSGHMLTYAFDLLYAIYEEEGYDAADIPRLILEKNLYGIELDRRAGDLAAFALVMKAREKHRRFFHNPVEPNICVLENIVFDTAEINDYIEAIGNNAFNQKLNLLLKQFEEADNLGSLIRPAITDVQDITRTLEEKNISGQLFLKNIHERVLKALEFADYLSPKYHIVLANPPYMGSKGMNEVLRKYALKNHPNSKSDLFAVFIERIMDMTLKGGFIGLMTPFTWMFLSSFGNLRARILHECTIRSLVKPSYTAFFQSAIVPICTFIINHYHDEPFKGSFFDLGYLGNAKEQPKRFLEALSTQSSKRLFKCSVSDFRKIPGSPIAYWISTQIRHIFEKYKSLSEFAQPRQGLSTGDNSKFLKFWQEVPYRKIGFGCIDRENAKSKRLKWFPCNKGGPFRKWFGNNFYVLNWENDGEEMKSFFGKDGKLRSRPQNQDYYFREGITWSTISSSYLSMRFSPQGIMFEGKGSMCFAKESVTLLTALGYANSILVRIFISAISPTLDFHIGALGTLPFKMVAGISQLTENLIAISQDDWDSYETSWDFTTLPLLRPEYRRDTLAETYSALRAHWREQTLEMQRLETENNRIFIEAYGLQDELKPEVPPEEITLTCNPYYRYDAKKSDDQLEHLLLVDTLKEFISYAVGCMFGRYSLDKPGLILADQGQTAADYTAHIPHPTFEPDEDNVIPVLDGDWFIDDIAGRFRKFLETTFGKDHLRRNLAFIETTLGKSIRKYFLTDFYRDHVKRYKKRPIYWMFSSPDRSFSALVYMHRINRDTVSVVLNDYLREFRSKLAARKDHQRHVGDNPDTNDRERSRALKDIEKLNKTIRLLQSWETDVLFPLASRRLDIDLDDGVAVNYAKYETALRSLK